MAAPVIVRPSKDMFSPAPSVTGSKRLSARLSAAATCTVNVRVSPAFQFGVVMPLVNAMAVPSLLPTRSIIVGVCAWSPLSRAVIAAVSISTGEPKS